MERWTDIKPLPWPGTWVFSKWELLSESIAIHVGRMLPSQGHDPSRGSWVSGLAFRGAVSLVTCNLKGFKNGPSLLVPGIFGWPKSSFGFFRTILRTFWPA